MQVKRDNPSETKAKLQITADQEELDLIKQAVLAKLGQNVKVQGFRPGKAPLNLIERQLDQRVFQSEFLEQAVNMLYVEAVQQERLRVVSDPSITVSKFVPFSTLEIEAEVEIIGDIKLPDYKTLKIARPDVKVVAKDVDEVIENLRTQAAEREEVKRACAAGDQVVIDFAGVDAKTKEPINGADSKAYPLLLGSNTFIPGFEENVLGMKAGEEKVFTLTFPKDYGVAALQNKKVEFTVTVTSVQKLTLPKVDDAFAASVGPFKSATELKADIKKQLEAERSQQAERDYENTVLQTIAEKTEVTIPEPLIESEIDRLEEEERRNLVYRGQTWQEHLKQEGITEEAHRERSREGATLRVKAGLVLTELSEREKITVTPEELEVRLQLLKGQYTDPNMQAELNKPEGRREILNRMVTEKTLDKLKTLVSTK